MAELHTQYHLYQPPRYRASDGSWNRIFRDAVVRSNTGPGTHLHWEPAAVMSINSYGYTCGDLTLLREIRRQPWLSEIGLDGQPYLLEIPRHDTLWSTYPEIARRLCDLLADEAEEASRDFDEVYVLLSGGLDSRVTAGTLARLVREGRLKSPPVAITWGLPDSRDVIYGREIARMLGMEWIYIPIDEEVLLRNVDWSAKTLAGMLSPVHQHMMEGLSRLSRSALVFGTSYGDSVGRAEFSGKHLLELMPLKPTNPFGLLAPGVEQEAADALYHELKALRDRTPGQPRYVICEHEMHAHYTRGHLAHAMSSINDFCTVYQLFTAPQVYSYMWSLHPALRYNEIYAELLDQLDPRLARLPWARTNQGMKGTSLDKSQIGSLRERFHLYRDWIAGPLYEKMLQRIDLERLAATGIFNMDCVRALIAEAHHAGPAPGQQPTYVMAWLATFNRLADWLDELGVQVEPVRVTTASAGYIQPVHQQRPGLLRRARNQLQRSPLLRRWVHEARCYVLRRQARKQFPPRMNSSQGVNQQGQGQPG